MPLLEYENVTAKLVSVTPISEKHGNRRESWQSLIIELVLPNTKLDAFDDQLRFAFYQRPDGEKLQGDLDVDPDELEGFTEKRFPWLRQDIEIERELSSCMLLVKLDDGLPNIELDAKKVCDFRIGFRDHGMFALRHRFVVNPSTMEKGRFEERLQQNINVTLTGQADPEQGDLLEPPKKRGRGRPRKNLADPVAAEPVQPAEEPRAPVETAPAKKAARKKAVKGEQNARDGAAWPFPSHERHSMDEPRGVRR